LNFAFKSSSTIFKTKHLRLQGAGAKNLASDHCLGNEFYIIQVLMCPFHGNWLSKLECTAIEKLVVSLCCYNQIDNKSINAQ